MKAKILLINLITCLKTNILNTLIKSNWRLMKKKNLSFYCKKKLIKKIPMKLFINQQVKKTQYKI